MTRTSFFLLAGATALSVVAAAATLTFDRTAPAVAAAGERLFPGLETSAGDIARLTFREGDFEAVIERRDGVFVDAASGYPVDTETLQEIVGALTLAEIAEAKTTDPARHADLGLAALDAEDGAGSEIVLENGAGETIAHVIAGDRDFTLGGISGGQYVRRGGEDATWLARVRIDPPTRRSGWFDTRLFETEAEDIVAASLTPAEGAPLQFARDGADFLLEVSLPEGTTPRDSQIARIPRLFATLDFDDVRAASDAAETGIRLSAETAEGVTITLISLESEADDSATWVRIGVEGSTDAARALAARVDGVEFALPNADAQVLEWSLDDLTETAES
ncbi:MAG: DUF4340 domain-containing protein [Rubricella sp.]